MGWAGIAGAISTAIWVYLLAGRGGFWRVRDDANSCRARVPAKRVAAIVPARDEAPLIGQAIASLAANFLPESQMDIFVVDDHSSDATAGIARASGVTVVNAGPLPTGWTGKVWALSEGVKHASPLRPDYFLFTDADIVHAPDDVSQLVARAEADGFDLVSFMVKLRCRSFAERALIPAFVYFFFHLYPPNWVSRMDRATAGAAGGCILIRREALEKIGGLACIRGQLIDDCALARQIKQSGGRIWLGLTSTTQSIREYGTFGQIERMISRTAYTQLRYSPVILVGSLAALTIVFLLPALLIPSGAGIPAYALMCVSFIPVLRFYGRSLLWALAMPLIAAFYMAATMHSAWLHWRGRGGAWKGRHLIIGSIPASSNPDIL